MKRLRSLLLTIALFASVLAVPRDLFGSEPAAPPQWMLERAQKVLDAHRAERHIPGATLAFILPNGEFGAIATGVARKSPEQTMKPTDRMLAGSVGKTYCAALALLLVEEGKLDLDAPIRNWLAKRPWFSRLPNANDITVRMLMNHTSGIAEHVTSPAFLEALRQSPMKNWTPDELASFAAGTPPRFPAGQGWSYADTNYILLAIVLEEILQRPYYDVVRERVLTPNHLAATGPSDKPDLPGLISGYVGEKNPFPVPNEVASDGHYVINPQFEWTGGGMISNAPDLARWAAALYGGNVLKAETRKMMLDGVKATLGPTDRYGLGTQLWTSPAHGEVVGHAGWFPGYVTLMAYYPTQRIALAFQMNTDDGASSQIMRKLLDDVLSEITRAP